MAGLSIFHFPFFIRHFRKDVDAERTRGLLKLNPQMANEKWKMENGKCYLFLLIAPTALPDRADQL